MLTRVIRVIHCDDVTKLLPCVTPPNNHLSFGCMKRVKMICTDHSCMVDITCINIISAHVLSLCFSGGWGIPDSRRYVCIARSVSCAVYGHNNGFWSIDGTTDGTAQGLTASKTHKEEFYTLAATEET